jgi:hypothetical protein
MLNPTGLKRGTILSCDLSSKTIVIQWVGIGKGKILSHFNDFNGVWVAYTHGFED